MTPTPHAFFTRDYCGIAVTIEVNSLRDAGRFESKTNGTVTASGRYREVLTVSSGIYPFWQYESGFIGPSWCDRRGGSLGMPDNALPSYISLLRTAAAYLSRGGFGFFPVGKLRLGFHSKYHQGKRARAAASRNAAA